MRGKRSPDGYVYLRCRLDIAFPILEVALEPARRALGDGRPRARARRRRPSWSSSSTRSSACATAGAGCRGASTRAPTGRWAAASRPASATSTRTSTASGSTRRCACSSTGATAARRCSPTSTPSSAPRSRRRTTSAPPGCSAGARGWTGCCAGSAGCCAPRTPATRLVLAPHPQARGRFDAFWIAGGRVVDWGALPPATRPSWRRAARPRCAPSRGRELGGWLPAGEVAETRLVGAWLAAHEPPALELDPAARGRPRRALGPLRRVAGRHDRGHRSVQLAAPPGSEEEARRFFSGCWGWRSCPSPSRWPSTAAPGSPAAPSSCTSGSSPSSRPPAGRTPRSRSTAPSGSPPSPPGSGAPASRSPGTRRSRAARASTPATRGATGWSSPPS